MVWISAIAALIVAAALIEAYLKRNTKRRLSDMRPDPEALKRRPWEPDGVTKVADIDKVHKANQKMEERSSRQSRRSL
ncbi:hypothetical protein [Roseibium sp. RKSG952]|uniref:hypothetical protein n=1 Tax=Roseibium sp. RKSG952 TaxID=2529384 RepID=UPI0012BC4F4C|nr:hypothetical protein [Roseibium sp. RKSG952]MTI01595.1 hypothetical protein [Roseibium sp. RKSG952]